MGNPCHIYSMHQSKWIGEFIGCMFYTSYFLRGYTVVMAYPVGKEIKLSPLAFLLLFL